MSDPIRAALRPLVHALRSLRDRTLHPVRRRRAERVVSDVPQIRSILFLCTGNICRSPYAEKALPSLLEAGGIPGGQASIVIASGGFLRSDRPSPPEAVRIAGERGIALGTHRSRAVDAQMLADVDLVVVMEVAHERKLRQLPEGRSVPTILLGDFDPESPNRREIRDPWGHPDEVFHLSFERVERCLGALVRRARFG